MLSRVSHRDRGAVRPPDEDRAFDTGRVDDASDVVDRRLHALRGHDAGLAAGEAVGGHAQVVEGHAEQGHGLALACREEHVHLPAGRQARNLAGQADQHIPDLPNALNLLNLSQFSITITKGAVIVPENASVSLNNTTKASAVKAYLRARNSENAPTAACMTREKAASPRVLASARTDCSGSVAASAVTVPISTQAAPFRADDSTRHDEANVSIERRVMVVVCAERWGLIVAHTQFAELNGADVHLRWVEEDPKVPILEVHKMSVAEVKQERRAPSYFHEEMRRLGLREGALSKYCLGIANLADGAKRNRFKGILRRLERLAHPQVATGVCRTTSPGDTSNTSARPAISPRTASTWK